MAGREAVQGLVEERVAAAAGDAACTHFPECNGCPLMKLPYPEQLQLKADILETVLGKAVDVVEASEQRFYRGKVEWSYLDGKLGFRRRADFRESFEANKCLLVSETAQQITAFLNEALKEKKVSSHDPVKHEGFLRYVVLREGKRTNERMVNFVSFNQDEWERLEMVVAALKDRFQIHSVNWLVNDTESDTAVGRVVKTWGEPHIKERLLNCNYLVEPNTFFQANVEMAEKLFGEALKVVGKNSTVLDVFCGVGTLTLPAAKKAGHAVGIDVVEDSIRLAKKNAQLNEVDNADFIAGKARAKLKNLQPVFDVVLLDPPRAGLSPKEVERVLALQAEKIAYVSCNPLTLAENLAAMEAGYEVKLLRGYDFFPNTAHVECLAVLERK